MNKRNDPKGPVARLPSKEKVVIESLDGDRALVCRIDGPRKGALAVSPIDKLKPA